MHTVTCPTCHNILKVPQPVFETKVRCTGCGAVFVGSSVPLDVSEPAVPQAPPAGRAPRDDHGRLYRSGPRQRASPSIAIAAGGGVAGVIVLAIICGYVMSTRSGKPTKGDPASPTGSEAGRGGGDQAPAGGQTAPPAGVGRTDTGTGGKTPPPKPPAKDPAGGASRLKNDEKIEVDLRQRHSSIGGVTTVYGEVRNNHDYPVKQIAIAFVYIDANDKVIRVGACSDCLHVPAKGRIGFKTKINKVPQGSTLQAVAGALPQPEGIVSWHVDTSEARYDTETAERTIIMRGTVSNPTATTVSNVDLYCDFFDREGVFYRTVTGKLTKEFRIQPGKSAAYKVELSGLLSVSGIKPQPILRLVGTAER